MSKQALIKRLRHYYPMEKIHAFLTFPLFTIYVIYTNALADIFFLVYGLLICIYILFQGQNYWKLKLYSLTGKLFKQHESIQFFKKAKNINIFLISFMPLIFILQLYINQWAFELKGVFVWSLIANIFAIAEYINYYHTQLMVDNMADLNYIFKNKKLKPASLKKDLEQNQL